jgi:2-haloacid dehalogenase
MQSMVRATALVETEIRAMQLSEFRALCFECYGVLIDKESGIHNALRPLLSKGHITLSRDEVLATFAQYESAQQLATPELTYSAILAGAHQRLAKAWGVVSFDDDHLLFGQSAPYWPVYADAPAALQYLKRYFKLIILTNGDREGLASSKRQLLVRFDAVFTAQEVGSYKPDLGNFQYLLAKLPSLGIATTQLLHIAASERDDLIPAEACGIATAWIDRHRSGGGSSGDRREPPETSCAFRFASMVDMVRAHQEQLVA